MKRLAFFAVYVLSVLILSSLGQLYAQSPGKKSLPPVPVTYPGDTDETIKRRAQWIEGAKKEAALDWWGAISPGDAAKVGGEFNKIYPFIRVSYWRGKGEEVAAKLEAEFAGGRPSADVVIGGEASNYPRWRKMGAFEKFTDIVPGIKNLDKRIYSRYGDWMIPGNNAAAPAYNTKKVSAAEAPKSWDDLLNPKWKGQIALVTDLKIWTTLALEEGGWGIEKTEAFLKKLGEQKPIWVQSRPAGHSLMIAGDFAIMGESYVYFTLQSQDREGAPVEWSRVRPVVVTGPAFNLLNGSPHPNAARLFLEWVFSPPGLVTYEKITYYGAASPGSGTRLAKALAGLPLVYRTEEGTIKSGEMGLEERFAKILGASLK